MEKSNNELKYWLALGKNRRIGSVTFSEIIATKRPLKYIFEANKVSLSKLYLKEKTISEILVCQEKYNPDKLLEELNSRDINVITIIDDDYPTLMKEIYDPPAILYYKGTLDPESLKLGMVGSRKPTEYGTEVTHSLAYDLALKGVTIVSGMAIGIDTIAHEAALEAGGKTIAVLGCGLDQIYPSRNVILAKKIIENGAIISEFPIGTPPLRYNFPIRNRIISGLTSGVIVAEATEKSGSLITASSAIEQNRDVYAVPGPIYNRNSQGPNNLLKMGAKVVTRSNDILDELGIEIETERLHQTLPEPANSDEADIINILTGEPKHIDAIIKESGLEQQKISSALTIMEISGKIKHIGGMVYRLNG